MSTTSTDQSNNTNSQGVKIPTKFHPKREQWQGSGWTVYTKKGPILNSEEIDHATETIGIPMPEMIFGNNEVGIEHDQSGWSIKFDALSALDMVDKTGERDGLVQVAHSKEWLKTRQGTTTSDGHEVQFIKPYDWTYSTKYAGIEDSDKKVLEASSDAQIPFEKLKRPDPILFFADISLYEDELGDNGIVTLNVKIRVMEERLLLLSRLFLRVDDVLFRLRDTRVCVEFATGEVIREYLEKEEDYNKVKKQVPSNAADFGQYLRDVNWVSDRITTKKVIQEKGKVY